jgi:SH3-like domain-containing protein
MSDKTLPTALTLLALLCAAPPAHAAGDNPSGLPLPRFATTRSDEINVRVGPGTRYDIAWVYVKAGQPVEIVQEFDTWRKIRDVDGTEGWVHQNMLSGKRAGIAAPWQGDEIPLLSNRDDPGGVRAWLRPGFRVDISGCDGAWCEVIATSRSEDGPTATYAGYLRQSNLWGVYQGEEFD